MNQGKEKIQNVILFLTDLLTLIVSYYTAGYIWLVGLKKIGMGACLQQLNDNFITVVVTYMLAFLFYAKNDDFIVRGKFEEFKAVFKLNIVMACIIAIYELLRRDGHLFPRGLYVFTIVINIILVYIVRLLVKLYIVKRVNKSASKIIMITTAKRAKELFGKASKGVSYLHQVSGIVVVDENLKGQNIEGIPVVANVHDMIIYIKNEIVDEVYLDLNYERTESIADLVMQLEDMGITVHLRLGNLECFKDFDMSLGQIDDIPVATFANRFYDYKQLAFKRAMDIAGALVGICIMAVAFIFVAPAIKIESKGPVFFKQKRVGKNGRYFYVYKFRSMYIDAEERKKELMAQNEMQGLMFKMKDDPRITKVGKFIRKTSIDELPQFINVLKGDMSLVGTRPPTAAEFKQYKGHHKRRLSMKPGITGMWQAYGRNTVTDFEEIVKMDLDYIDHWSLGLDVKILCRTFIAVFQGG